MDGALAVLVALLALASALVNTHVPAAYMDEIFHVPQTQQYCDGDFWTWDPMITTFPGLYLAALALLRPLAVLGGGTWGASSTMCSVPALRAVNGLFLLGIYSCCVGIVEHLYPTLGKSAARVRGLTLALYPLNFFFASLFYTDNGGTLFVLLAYLMSLRRNYQRAALAACVATGFRQSNIVWLVLVACSSAARLLDDRSRAKGQPPCPAHSTAPASIAHYLKAAYQHIGHVLSQLGGFLCALVCFGAFLRVNGGVVVGAQADHAMVVHIPQLFYFTAFAAAFAGGPWLAWHGVTTLGSALRRPLVYLYLGAALAFAVYGVHYHTHEHRYLLADNRHYTFYVWNKLFRRWAWFRYAACPVYVFCAWCLAHDAKAPHALWRLLFLLCTAVALVPSPLLELRYFTVPYMLAALHSRSSHAHAAPPPPGAPAAAGTWWPALGDGNRGFQLLLNGGVDAVALYMFVARPFTAPDGSVGRFMY